MHAIIFDIDGTLLESAAADDALYRDAVSNVLGPVRFRETLEHYDYVTDSGILTQVLADNALPGDPDPSGPIRSRFVEMLRRHIQDNGPFPEIPGAKSVVQALLEAENHAVAIATGGWGDSARLKLESAGFPLNGIPLASADDARDRVEIMRIALGHLGTSFETVTYYGDGPWDRAASEQLGWRFVPVGSALGGLRTYEVSSVIGLA